MVRFASSASSASLFSLSLSCSLFPVPCSLFPVPCSLFPVPCSLFPDSKDAIEHERNHHKHRAHCADHAPLRRSALKPQPRFGEEIVAPPPAVATKGHLGVRDARPTMPLHPPLIHDR